MHQVLLRTRLTVQRALESIELSVFQRTLLALKKAYGVLGAREEGPYLVVVLPPKQSGSFFVAKRSNTAKCSFKLEYLESKVNWGQQ